MKNSKGIVRSAVKKLRALTKNGGSSTIYKSLKIEIEDNGFKVVGDPAYRFYLNGRKPGKRPPIKSLRAWAKRKGIPERALYPIAKKIGEQGTKGRKRVKRATRRHLIKSYREYAKAIMQEEARKKD